MGGFGARPLCVIRAAYLANGITGGVDALAVGPLAGSGAATVLTVPSTGLPKGDEQYLAGNSHLTTVSALGRPDAVLAAAQAATGWADCRGNRASGQGPVRAGLRPGGRCRGVSRIGPQMGAIGQAQGRDRRRRHRASWRARAARSARRRRPGR